jgi:hypothetical protein
VLNYSRDTCMTFLFSSRGDVMQHELLINKMTPSPWLHSPSRPCNEAPSEVVRHDRFLFQQQMDKEEEEEVETSRLFLNRNWLIFKEIKKIWILISNQYYTHFRWFVPFLSLKKDKRDGGKFEISIRLDIKMNSKRSGKLFFVSQKSEPIKTDDVAQSCV